MKRLLYLFLMICPLVVFAAPVIDSSGSVAVNTASSNPSDSNQLLVQQAQNLVQMNLPQQIQMLQQSIQDLRGIVEIQGHQIDTLEKAMTQLTGKTLPAVPTQSASDATSSAPTTQAVSQLMSPATIANTQQQHLVSDQNAKQNSSSSDSNASHADSSDHVSGTPSKEQTAYQAAYQNIQNKNYSDAIKGMQGYLTQYPAGQYAANAHYWLGELYMISGDNQKASDEFNSVVQGYPQSNKTPDAMLKLGMIAMASQDYKAAKQAFNDLVKAHPDSPAARVATKQLQQLSQAGY